MSHHGGEEGKKTRNADHPTCSRHDAISGVSLRVYFKRRHLSIKGSESGDWGPDPHDTTAQQRGVLFKMWGLDQNTLVSAGPAILSLLSSWHWEETEDAGAVKGAHRH